MCDAAWFWFDSTYGFREATEKNLCFCRQGRAIEKIGNFLVAPV